MLLVRWRGQRPGLRRRHVLRIEINIYFWRAVFVRPAINHGLEIEVAMPWRARRLPFQRIRVPRITTRRRTEANAVEEIHRENDLRADHQNGAPRHKLVQS